jgi:hypothetical protein
MEVCNAYGGRSFGALEIERPWDAFGLMDHLTLFW